MVQKVRKEKGLKINKRQGQAAQGGLVADDPRAEVQRGLVQAGEDLDRQPHKGVLVPAGVLKAVVQAGPLTVGGGVGVGLYHSRHSVGAHNTLLHGWCEVGTAGCDREQCGVWWLAQEHC